MGIENPVHLLFLGAVALLVLGPKRLPTLARTLGEGIRQFRDAVAGQASETDPVSLTDGAAPEKSAGPSEESPG